MMMKPKEAELPRQIVTMLPKLDPALAKYGLDNHVARVALMLDISGSMDHLYSSGKVQRTVDQAVALGYRFDDNAAIDLFAFGQSAYHFGEVTTENFGTVLKDLLKKHRLEGGTRYDRAIACLRNYYFGFEGVMNVPYKPDAKPPVYCIFVTDGDTQYKEQAVAQIQSASFAPMFIQFIAIGANFFPNEHVKEVPPQKKGFLGSLLGSTDNDPCPREFRFLHKLDAEVPGRYVDNANFFSINSPDTIEPEKLFELMMSEYPQWLELDQVKAMLGRER
ncbi:MAG TPA: VWA domain-containing protein [Patescibacteria group bacterium]|nr:VWA domain-containing protein [Patescibacteria group bacterium]